MKTLTLKLPLGAVQRGHLYRDSGVNYGSGDVLEVELPTGFMIDLGWNPRKPETPFRVVVYREYFGDHFVDFYVGTAEEAANAIETIASRLCANIAFFSCSASESSYVRKESMFLGSRIAVACSDQQYFTVPV
jgi:hypothetical protein